MYWCRSCKTDFEEPARVLASVEEFWGEKCCRYESVCPYCGSDEYEEADSCVECGSPYIPPVDDESGLCPVCRKQADDIITTFINNLKPGERNRFDELYERRETANANT